MKKGLWTMTMDNNFKIIDIITRALYEIDRDGQFIGNDRSGYRGDGYGTKSTKDKVVEFVHRQQQAPNPDYTIQSYDENFEGKLSISQLVVDYFRYMKPSQNEFINTCIALSLQDTCTEKAIGYIVAMVPTYLKGKERDAFNQAHKNSDYVGVPGKRKNFFVKLLQKHHMQDHESYIYTFCDRNKNLIKTWVTYDKHEAWEMKIGDCIDLDGFVRKHEINKYSDIRETFINRVKVIDNKGAAT